MKKRNKIIYWIATVFLAFGMLAGGVQQLLQIGGYVDIVRQLGYPLYLLSILGVWKILGVIAMLIPKFPLVKEWLMQASSLSCPEQQFHILRWVSR